MSFLALGFFFQFNFHQFAERLEVVAEGGMQLTKGEINKIRAARKEYDELVVKSSKTAPEGKAEYKTDSWIPVDRLYTPADVEGIDYLKDISFPGQYPFTRGLFQSGYRTRGWSRRQVAGYGTPEECNRLWKYLISQGQNALTVAASCGFGGTKVSWDSDDDMMVGYGGKTYTKTDTLADWEELLDGIPLDKINVLLPTDMWITFAMFVAAAEKKGYERRNLSGSVAGKVRLILYPENKGNPYIDMVEFCAKEMPNWNAFYVDARNVREGGLTAVQEIAWAIAVGMDGVREVMKRGIDVDQFGPRIQFYIDAGMDLFEEVAKFRALRRMWAKVMKEKFGAKDPRSWRFRAGVQTYGPAMTSQQPLNNLVRGAIQCLAAVLGGAQSISVQTFDEPLSTPSEFSQVLALRTAQIIEHETGVVNVVDPLGGSYYVEWLTNKLEEEAQKMIDKLEELGGACKTKAASWFYQQMMASASRYQKEIDNKERIVVGVNDFVMEDDPSLALFAPKMIQYDPSIIQRQIERLKKIRRERDNAKVEQAKKILYDTLKARENIMPPLIEAVKSYITGGEITKVLMEARGEQYGPARAQPLELALFTYH